MVRQDRFSRAHWTAALRAALRPHTLIPGLAAGLAVGLIEVIIVIALASLIFSGDLAGDLPRGLGLMLFGTIVMLLVTTLTSSIPGIVSSPQDTPAAIMALVAAAIAAHIPGSASPDDTFITVMAAFVAAALLTGGVFLLLGYFKLGNLVRFIPYPVIGGFLAGVGLLLVRGAITSMTGAPLSLSETQPLTDPDLLVRWLPGLALGGLLLIMLRRYSHFLIMPGTLLAAAGIFYLALAITGTSVTEATDHGWLSAVFQGGGLWHPLTPGDLDHVHWSVLSQQAGDLGAIALLSIIGLLLNASALELASRQDVELNRELKAAGLANLLAGLGGGLVGYAAVSDTVLAYRMGVKSRVIGVVTALVCAAIMVAGGTVLAYVPNLVLGGLLMMIGLHFIAEWVYDAWVKLPRTDYLIVILILAVINTLGLLEGVGLGILVAGIMFVVSYSRIDVVRHELTGTNFHSNIVRPSLYRQLLHQKGDWTYILRLQGFIFFGTCQKLLDQVRTRIEDGPRPHFIVLDFRQVSGLDSSAMLSFTRIKQLAQAHEVLLVFTSLSPQVRRQMDREVFNDPHYPIWRVFPDLDRGVEWCENQALEIMESVGISARRSPRRLPFDEIVPDPQQSARLMTFLEKQVVEAEHYLMHQHDAPGGLYFLEQGQISIQLEMEDGSTVRLRKMDAGTLVGELGTYLHQPATASVITTQPSTLYHLSVAALHRLEHEEPEIASAFHRFMVRFLAERLTQTTETLQALVD